MGLCDKAPAASVGHNYFGAVTPETALGAVSAFQFETPIGNYDDLEAYRAKGGYKLLEACWNGQHTPDGIAQILSGANLRGLGGAGFPAGRKWGFVRAYPGPRYVAINVDEGEPGTFKDRYYLERDPHRMIEGALIASWAMEAERCFIYVRDEYPHIIEIFRREIEKLEQAGLTTPGYLDLRRGAGAYICGEELSIMSPSKASVACRETGLLIWRRWACSASRRSNKTPKPCFGSAISWRRARRGSRNKAATDAKVCAHFRSPAASRSPASSSASGITMNELLHEYCGGMADGTNSMPICRAGVGRYFACLNGGYPDGFRHTRTIRVFYWFGRVVVLSRADSAKTAALNTLRFFEEESAVNARLAASAARRR